VESILQLVHDQVGVGLMAAVALLFEAMENGVAGGGRPRLSEGLDGERVYVALFGTEFVGLGEDERL